MTVSGSDRLNPEDISDSYNKNQSESFEENSDDDLPLKKRVIGTDFTYKHQVIWSNAIGFLILHVLGIWGFILCLTGQIYLNSFIWLSIIAYTGGEGVTIGAHRLFTHKSFKATPLLKACMILMQTIAGQNSMFIWCRDHRLHHRYTDTDGDPHNSKRGFFFSHCGWLMSKKHPYVKELGKKIYMSDLQADWMVMLQKKYYYYLYFLLAFWIPVWVPVHYFNEPWWNSILCCYFFRYVASLNFTWLVNSAAHLYGTRPYDKTLQPVESWFVSLVTLGEGWHNYHHAFPWDYKTAELSMHFNLSASFIRFFERFGLAYDLKSASPDMVKNRVIRTGDGTHYELGDEESKKCVDAIGILHPLNPSYSVKYKDPEVNLKLEGLPLFQEKDVLSENSQLRNIGSQ